MYCPNCGSKCEEGHKFCFYCGTPLPQTDSKEPEKPDEASSALSAPIEPEACIAAEENTPVVLTDLQTTGESPIDCSPKKGRLWPPFVLMVLMITIGLFVFFLTGSQNGTDPDMPWFQVKGGVLYFDATLYTGSSELIVPKTIGGQTVTALSEGCFANCNMLTTVVLPDTLTEIGPWAFTMCTSIRGIYVPESVRIIGTQAFSGCTALEAIYIPGTVTSIEQQAFLLCSNLHYVFFIGSYQQWCSLYSEVISSNTLICCTDGVYRYQGPS